MTGTVRSILPGRPEPANGAVRILVALADPIARHTVTRALEDAPDVDCVGEVATGAEAVALVEAGIDSPQLVVMDESMPDVDAVAAAHLIVEARPEVRVVMLASDADAERGILALRAGAAGYLSKEISLAVLPRVLRKVAEGEAAVPRTLTARLIDRLREMPPAAAPAAHDLTAPARQGRHGGTAFAGGIFGFATGMLALIVAQALPHSAADVTAGSAYLKSEYYVLLLIAGAEAVLGGLALAGLTVVRPATRAAPILLAITIALGVLLLTGSMAALLDYQVSAP